MNTAGRKQKTPSPPPPAPKEQQLPEQPAAASKRGTDDDASEAFHVSVVPWARVPAWDVGSWRKGEARGRAGVVSGSGVRCAAGAEEATVVAARCAPLEGDPAGVADGCTDYRHRLWSPGTGAESDGFGWGAEDAVQARVASLPLAYRSDGAAVACPVGSHQYVGRGVWPAGYRRGSEEGRAKRSSGKEGEEEEFDAIGGTEEEEEEEGGREAKRDGSEGGSGKGSSEKECEEVEEDEGCAYPLLWEVVSVGPALRFACWSAPRMPAVVRADETVLFPWELRGEGRSVPVAELHVGRDVCSLAVWEAAQGVPAGGGSSTRALVAAVLLEDELRIYAVDGPPGQGERETRFRLVVSIPCGLWLSRSSCFAPPPSQPQGSGEKDEEEGEKLRSLVSPDALVFNDDGTLLLLCALDGCAVFSLQWGDDGDAVCAEPSYGYGNDDASCLLLTAWPVCRGFFRNRVAGGVFASATRCLLFSRFPARVFLWDVCAAEVVWAATLDTAPLHSLAYRPFRPAGGPLHEHGWPTARPLPSPNQPWTCDVCRVRQPLSAACAECACGARGCEGCAHVHAWGPAEAQAVAWRCGVCGGRRHAVDEARVCGACRVRACRVCVRGPLQEPRERAAAVFASGARGLFVVTLPQQPGGCCGGGGVLTLHPEWQHYAFVGHEVPARTRVGVYRSGAAQWLRGEGAKRKKAVCDDDAGAGGGDRSRRHRRRRHSTPSLYSVVTDFSSQESGDDEDGSGGSGRGEAAVARMLHRPQQQHDLFAPAPAPAGPYPSYAAQPAVSQDGAPRLYPVVALSGAALQPVEKTTGDASPPPVADDARVAGLLQQLFGAAKPHGTWRGQQQRGSGKLRLVPPHREDAFHLRGCTRTMRFAQDGAAFVIFTRDEAGVGEVVVLSGKTGVVWCRICIPHRDVLSALCLSEALLRLVVVDSTHLTCYDVRTNCVAWRAPTPCPLSAPFRVVLSPTGCVVVPRGTPARERVDARTWVASDWGAEHCPALATCAQLHHASWLPLSTPVSVMKFAKMEGLRDLLVRGFTFLPSTADVPDDFVDTFLATA